MSKQLLPCPFCGHDEPTHDEGDQSAWVQCTNFECGMCGPIASGPSLAAAAWNRRATQPAAGEPIGKVELFGINMTYVEWRDRKMPPLGTEIYAAPPAAAHGDEAVRKDATESAIQRACRELPEGWSLQIELERGAGDVTLFNAWDIVVDFGQDFESSISEQVEAAIDAAMRAQGEGGSGDA